MRKRIGTVRLVKERIVLDYYQLGSRKEGYGLEVVEKAGGITRRECCEKITRNRRRIQSLGAAVMRGIVFPGFLSEIAAEWEL